MRVWRATGPACLLAVLCFACSAESVPGGGGGDAARADAAPDTSDAAPDGGPDAAHDAAGPPADAPGGEDGACRGVTGDCGPCGLPGPDGCVLVGVAACPDGFVQDGCGCAPVLDEDCGAVAIPRLGGGCVPVGPQTCAAGFARDADGACRPVLAECGEDELPLLGGACVAVGDTQGCGEGTFGDIPDDPGTVYVDPEAAGEAPDGSRANPYRDLATALAAAPDGGTVALAAGRYTGYPAIRRSVRLRGRCAARVWLEGTPRVTLPGYVDDLPARLWIDGADGVTVEGVSVEGGNALGIVVSGARDVTVRQVRVGAVAFGVLCHSSEGVTVEHVRLTGVGQVGLHFKASTGGTVRRCLVADTREAGGQWGWGVNFEGSLDGQYLVEENLVRNSRGRGIRLAYTSGVLRGNLVADTAPSADNPEPNGIDVDESASAVLERNIVAGGAFIGIRVSRAASYEIDASDVRLVANVVRDTEPPADGSGCSAVRVQLDSGADQAELSGNVVSAPACRGVDLRGPVAAAVEGNSVLAARGTGLATVAVSGTIRHNLFSDVDFDPLLGGSVGLGCADDVEAARTRPPLVVSRNHVRNAQGGGLGLLEVAGSVEENWIHDIAPPPENLGAGYGLLVSGCPEVTVRGNVVARCFLSGLWFSRSTGQVDGNIVSDTTADPPIVDDRGVAWSYGAALVVFEAPQALVTRNVLRRSTLWGLAVFFGSATLEGNVVEETTPGPPEDSGFGVACFGDGERLVDVVVRGNTVSRASGAGIVAIGVSGVIEGNAVRDTLPGEVEGEDGARETVADGVQVFAADMDVRGCYTEGTARAGIVVRSVQGTVSDNLVRGAVFGVDREGDPLADLGPNACCEVLNLCATAGEGLVVQTQVPLPPLPVP